MCHRCPSQACKSALTACPGLLPAHRANSQFLSSETYQFCLTQHSLPPASSGAALMLLTNRQRFPAVHTCRRLSTTTTCQSKHAERARARRMGVADLYTLAVIGRPSKNVGLQCGELSATFVGKCERPVIPRNKDNLDTGRIGIARNWVAQIR